MKLAWILSGLIFLSALILLIACNSSNISQSRAESVAKQFVNDHAKFYSDKGNVSQYDISTMSAELADNKWNLILNVSSSGKSSKIPVTIDAESGKVVLFNGIPVLD